MKRGLVFIALLLFLVSFSFVAAVPNLSSEPTCPLYHPSQQSDWCENGTIIPSPGLDENGCEIWPRCVNLTSEDTTILTGGSCSYDEYAGECKIVSILKTDASSVQLTNSGYKGFEVKFKFNSTNNSLDLLNHYTSIEHLLLLTNSWYPGQMYLDKYKIVKENVFDCKLKIINSGTCSPFVFEFEDINLIDYFETGANQDSCGNNKCDGIENYFTCPEDCKEQNRTRKIIQIKNRLRATLGECPEACVCSGSTVKCSLNGTRTMTIYAGNSGNTIVQVKGINASTNVTLYKSEGKIFGVFRNNQTKEILLPDHVRAKIRERLRAQLENESLELDENATYYFSAQKKARLFWIFPVKEKIKYSLNAETGEIIKYSRPWWGWLANDIEEEDEGSEEEPTNETGNETEQNNDTSSNETQ